MGKALAEEKGWHRFIIVIYVGCAVAAGLVAGHLHHLAFAAAQSPGQAYVVVFTQDVNARVSLTVQVYPNRPWRDHVDVTARGVSDGRNGGAEKFLLVIQCPSQRSRGPQSQLYSEAGQSFPNAPVGVFPGVDKKSMLLGCFGPATKSVGLANVVLPGLETDQAIEALEIRPTVYETTARPHPPVNVIQMFSSCPALGEAPSNSSPSSSPSPGAATASPTSSVLSAGCASLANLRLKPGEYHLPTTMQTREVLKFVNLDGFSAPSVFPVPEITSDNSATGQNSEQQYAWTSQSSLLPSFVTTNLDQAAADNRYGVDDGVAWGLFSAAAFLSIDRGWELITDWRTNWELTAGRWKKRRQRKKDGQKEPAAEQSDDFQSATS